MDILSALKQEKRELETKLGQVEKAISAYGGEKKPKPAKSNGHSVSTPAPIAPGKLPDRIIEYLGTWGPQSAAEIAEQINAPVGPVATTCSRLVRGERLVRSELEGVAVYDVPKKVDEDSSPFKK